MKPADPLTLPTVEPEVIERRRRLRRLIDDIKASETYDHAMVFHFCGTPACACGHFLAAPDLRAEFDARHPDIVLPADSRFMFASPQVIKRVAADLSIPWRVFDDPSPFHDGTKAGVLAYLRKCLAEMEG